MAEQSWWINCPREVFRAKVNDPERLARLRSDKSYFLQSGWAEEKAVDRRRPPSAYAHAHMAVSE